MSLHVNCWLLRTGWNLCFQSGEQPNKGIRSGIRATHLEPHLQCHTPGASPPMHIFLPTPSLAVGRTPHLDPSPSLPHHHHLGFCLSDWCLQTACCHTIQLFCDTHLALLFHALGLLSGLGDRSWTQFEERHLAPSIALSFSTPYLGEAGSKPVKLHTESPNHCSVFNLLTKTAADAINLTVVFLIPHCFTVTLFWLFAHAVDTTFPLSSILRGVPENRRKQII